MDQEFPNDSPFAGRSNKTPRSPGDNRQIDASFQDSYSDVSNMADHSKERGAKALSDSEQEEEPEPEGSHEDQEVTRHFKYTEEGTLLVDTLEGLVSAIARAKRTPSTTQTKQLQDVTQDLKNHLTKLHAKFLQLQGKYAEQAVIIDKLIHRDSREIKETIVSEMAKIAAVKVQAAPVQLSYANAARGLANHRQPKRTVVLAYPNKEQSSDETATQVKSNLERMSNDLRIHKLTNISKGGVVIQVQDEQQIAQIRAALETVVEFREPKAKLPKLIIYDLPSEDTPEEVKERIYNQNFRDSRITKQEFDGNTKMVFKTGPRDIEVCNWIVETTREIREQFIAAGRVFYQVHSCKVADYHVVTRCYKCQRYGHVSKYCKALQDVCSHCGKEGHRFRDCPDKQKDPLCCNCIRAKKGVQKAKHSVLSKDCPTFIGAKERSLAE